MRYFWVICLIYFFAPSAAAQITGIKVAGDPCVDLTLTIQVTGTSSSPYFFWNFGDPASGTNDTITITGASTAANPVHTFTSPGFYRVCATFQEPGMPIQSVCDTLAVLLCCNGIINTIDSCLQNVIPFQIITSDTINSISWNFGDPASGASNISGTASTSHRFSSSGNYTVTALVTASCGTYTVSYPIAITDCSPPLCVASILVSDTCLANGSEFSLTQPGQVSNANWNFGDANSGSLNVASGSFCSHTFSSIGTYYISVTATYPCGVLILRDTVEVIECSTPCSTLWTTIDSCVLSDAVFSIGLRNGIIDSVQFFFGDNTDTSRVVVYGSLVYHKYSSIGVYEIRAKIFSSCGVDSIVRMVTIVNCTSGVDSQCTTIFPNAFTPNGDGVNDNFKGFSNCPVDQFKLNIYNRWGQLIYVGNSLNDAWNGFYNNQAQPSGTYVFTAMVSYASSKMKFYNGNITLLR